MDVGFSEHDRTAGGPSWDEAEHVIEQDGKALFAAVRGHARSYQDAEEIYGMLLLEFWQAFARGTITGDLRAYIFGRVGFRSCDFYRKKVKHDVPVGDDLLDEIHLRPGALLDEDVALHGDLSPDLVAALWRLHPDERNVVVLRHIYDLTEKEAAKTLGVSEATAKRRSRRGLCALRDQLPGYGRRRLSSS